MHHSNISVFSFYPGFMILFTSKDTNWCLNIWKLMFKYELCCVWITTSGIMFTKRHYYTIWPRDMVIWPYAMPILTILWIPDAIACCVLPWPWHNDSKRTSQDPWLLIYSESSRSRDLHYMSQSECTAKIVAPLLYSNICLKFTFSTLWV